MSKIQIKELAQKLFEGAKKTSPEILIGMGIAGFIFGTIYSIKVSRKATNAIDAEKQRFSEETGEEVKKLPVKNVIKATWKIYIPVVAVELVSAACIIGSSAIHLKRNAALVAAYTISESARKEYESKVKEVIGEKKEEEIKEKIAEDQLKNTPVSECKNIINTGHGNTLCFDSWNGRYFWSDREYIRQAVNDMNAVLLNEDTVYLNDLYYSIGLDSCGCGSVMGWNLAYGQIRVKYTSKLSDTGVPCLVMSFETRPIILD